jgi:hypothetical protein
MSTKIYDPKKDLINTLSYKNIFNQPMTLYQLIYFGHTRFDSLNDIETHLKDLLEKHKIRYKLNYYFLGTTKSKKDEIKIINTKFNLAQNIYKKLESIAWVFEGIPFIKYVGVTGTLASYNFDFEKDDIDLFFICSKNRLWITRFIVVLILKFLNLYVNNLSPKLKICPNLYISEDRMEWKPDKRTLYVAHEIIMMQPLVNKENFYFKFLAANVWIKDFLPNFEFSNISEPSEYTFGITILDLVESFLMYFQKLMMKVRYGSEILDKDFIHFIKVDHSNTIIENYEKIKS